MTNRQYAIMGMLAPVTFWVTYFIMANLRPEYNFLHKAISELGSVDAPNKWVWNIFGYIIPGLLISFYSFGLKKEIEKENKTKLPLSFYGILLSGLFMALSGVFPADMDNRQSPATILHMIGSFGGYIFFLLAAFTFPQQMKRRKYWKSTVSTTLIFTWLTIIFGSWVWIFPDYPSVGQRIVFFFYFAWIGFTSYKLYITEMSFKEAR